MPPEFSENTEPPLVQKCLRHGFPEPCPACKETQHSEATVSPERTVADHATGFTQSSTGEFSY
jgi:hypothetical protein